LSGLSETIYLAQKMGKELGKCTLLLKTLRFIKKVKTSRALLTQSESAGNEFLP